MKDLNAYWQDSLAGKKVLITGGTTGIGRELAVLLTSFGANCLICGRNQEQIEQTIAAAEEDEPSGTCTGVALDLSTEDGISHLFDVLDHLQVRPDAKFYYIATFVLNEAKGNRHGNV